jgi:hypothetical protein
MKRQHKVALFALAVGLMLIPATDAMGVSSLARERAQNARITRAIKATQAVANKVFALNTKSTLTVKSLTDLTGVVGGIDTRLKTLEAGAPALVSALTQLATAAQQLKDGLTTVGAGLTKLAAAYGAVEYGRAGVFASGATVQAGGVATSADIPDDGNPISTGDDAILTVSASGAVAIDLKAAIRSAESDGDDPAKTAGQAGGFLYVININTGARVACGGTPNPPGIIGTQPGDSIVTPSGTVTNLPLKNIPGGVLRTDTTKPDASSTSLLPAACQFAGTAGDVYSVHYSVNFLDIPTSTTPGPTE